VTTASLIPNAVRTACERAQRMIEASTPSGDVLHWLVAAAEDLSGPGCVVSILVLDDCGLLRNGASPNLPEDYLEAIDRLKPDAKVGTCAAAAATGSMVITPSFLADGKWTELRHLPLALGFVGAWSMPIKSLKNGRVLGTFGTYYRDTREPTAVEIVAVEALASKAAAALELVPLVAS
jgi:GAF domain-containing protein